MSKHLLLLHGALGTQQQLIPLANLVKEQFTVHYLNFEGHGGRASSATIFSIDLFVENVLQFLQEQQLDSVAIFGYSMGGYVALRLAQQHPQLVDKIITLGTKFDWSVEAASKEVKMLNPSIIEQKVPKFATQLQKAHAPNDWKLLLDKTAQMMLHLAHESKLTTQDLEQIQQEVLIGIGSLDNMVGVAESEQAATALPNAQLQLIEGFYHPLEKNDLQQLVPLIRNFVGS
ncbi:MAG: alpha/beta fold hydrolase [Aureispira sp.]